MRKYVDGGQALLRAFRSLDVDYVFTASGSEWAPYWEAIALQKEEGIDGPVYLDLWHETVAVAMATGYALVSGRMQVVLLHAGPGLLQGSCAIHGALLANAPMLVCSSESLTYGERDSVDPGSQWYRNLSIVGGPHNIADAFVKWSNQVPSIETLYEMVVRAGEMAQRAQPGPVYLNVPVEVLLEPWSPPSSTRQTPRPALKVSPPDEIDSLVELLVAATSPVVLTETAGRDQSAFAALTELCEELAIPVVEPQSAVCANFPRRHPMHLGGSQDQFVSEETDLVLLVNCRSPWYPPSSAPPNARTVVLDEVPQRPHMVYQVLHADTYLEGNVATTLLATVAAARERGTDARVVESRREKISAVHDRLMDDIEAAEAKAAANRQNIEVVYLVSQLRDLTPADSIFVDETITHGRPLRQHLLLDEPGRYYYSQGGLGQGIGLALGIKLAAGKDRMVVLAIGDGSFLYNPIAASFAASRDLDLPLLVVIFNNREYRSMKLNHLRFYPDGVAATNDDFHGVDLGTQPDLSSFAAPFDMFGETVMSPDDLPEALRNAVDEAQNGRMAILNVMVTQ